MDLRDVVFFPGAGMVITEKDGKVTYLLLNNPNPNKITGKDLASRLINRFRRGQATGSDGSDGKSGE